MPLHVCLPDATSTLVSVSFCVLLAATDFTAAATGSNEVNSTVDRTYGDPCGYSTDASLVCCIGLFESFLIKSHEECCNGRATGPHHICCGGETVTALAAPDHDACCLHPDTRQGRTFDSTRSYCRPSTGQVLPVPVFRAPPSNALSPFRGFPGRSHSFPYRLFASGGLSSPRMASAESSPREGPRRSPGFAVAEDRAFLSDDRRSRLEEENEDEEEDYEGEDEGEGEEEAGEEEAKVEVEEYEEEEQVAESPASESTSSESYQLSRPLEKKKKFSSPESSTDSPSSVLTSSNLARGETPQGDAPWRPDGFAEEAKFRSRDRHPRLEEVKNDDVEEEEEEEALKSESMSSEASTASPLSIMSASGLSSRHLEPESRSSEAMFSESHSSRTPKKNKNNNNKKMLSLLKSSGLSSPHLALLSGSVSGSTSSESYSPSRTLKKKKNEKKKKTKTFSSTDSPMSVSSSSSVVDLSASFPSRCHRGAEPSRAENRLGGPQGTEEEENHSGGSGGSPWGGEVVRCCGGVAYLASRQICCRFTLFDLPSRDARCCHDQAYLKEDDSNPCMGLCGRQTLDSETQLCCRGVVHNSSTSARQRCCGADVISTRTHTCCAGGSVSLELGGPTRCCQGAAPYPRHFVRCRRSPRSAGRLQRKGRVQFSTRAFCARTLPAWGRHWPLARLQGHMVRVEGHVSAVWKNGTDLHLTLTSVLLPDPLSPEALSADTGGSCLNATSLILLARLPGAQPRRCRGRQLQRYLRFNSLTVYSPLSGIRCGAGNIPVLDIPDTSYEHLILMTNGRQRKRERVMLEQ